MENINILQKEKLESQIRNEYGKVMYTYTAHWKDIDMISDKMDFIKWGEIILSLLTTGGILGIIFGTCVWFEKIAALSSAALLGFNLYFKEFDLVDKVNRHRFTADLLWNMLRNYESLLTDLPILSINEINEKRDKFQNELSMIYKTAPPTSSDAYTEAQKALKVNKEQYFTDIELDKLLPPHLRKSK